MSQSHHFNYIITIHNKEDLIEQVMTSVLTCCRDNSSIYAVLDGCTDKSEAIIDGIADKFANVPITKIVTPDVHEILSINAGLRAANQEGDGFNIILQDDVLLADSMIESKVIALYDWFGPQLGLVSFRHGANFFDDAVTSAASVPFRDYVENAYGHGSSEAQVLLPGQLAYRTVSIKSPICIPFHLIRSVGMLEERLAPYMHDDTDYSIRCIRAGFRNAVFALRFNSDVRWGGTRVTPHPEMGNITKRNMDLIRAWHHKELEDICNNTQPTRIIQLSNMAGEEEKGIALDAWRKVLRKNQDYRSKRVLKAIAKKFKFFDRYLL
jgi:Glycosyltransferase like family 2